MAGKKSLTQQHMKSLEENRLFITNLINQLDKVLNKNEYDENESIEWKYIWGEKENVVSSLNKLTGLLLKIITIEQQLNEKSSTKTLSIKKKGRILDSTDKEIIRRYVKKFGKAS